MSNKEKYHKVFMETFGIPLDKVPDMQFSTCVEWDSVAHLQLIAALEDAFNIMMEMDDIVEFSSYNKGKELLLKYDIAIE
jgi:acyl carrier protein